MFNLLTKVLFNHLRLNFNRLNVSSAFSLKKHARLFLSRSLRRGVPFARASCSSNASVTIAFASFAICNRWNACWWHVLFEENIDVYQ